VPTGISGSSGVSLIPAMVDRVFGSEIGTRAARGGLMLGEGIDSRVSTVEVDCVCLGFLVTKVTTNCQRVSFSSSSVRNTHYTQIFFSHLDFLHNQIIRKAGQKKLNQT
jgi:hypothetical protein